MTVDLLGDRYELLDRIGAGGMGEVYRSRDRLTEEIVAVKRALQMPVPTASTNAQSEILGLTAEKDIPSSFLVCEPPDLRSENTLLTRMALASEFRVLSSLRHPNIISVLDFGFQTSGLPFFTMELLSGAVTITRAAEQQTLDVKLDLIFQMLQALSYLHRRGIIHRDLKPSNVLVTRLQVTLLDFGVAGLPEGTLAGTVGFIAPELLQGAHPTPASDFYALGCIAYEILTGEPPYDEHAPEGQIPDLLPLERHGPVGELVITLLSPDPQHRHHSDANRLMMELARATGREVPTETSAYRESYLRAAPLVGRQTELTILSNALECAIAGQGSAWLVEGESGIGKSRLLDEVRCRALVEGLLALRGSAEQNKGPYSAFHDIVLRLALVVPISDKEASVFKIVFPQIERVLARRINDEVFDPQIFPEMLIEAIIGLFARYKKPVLLELEDCHQMDESTSLMQRLAKITDTLPLLVVASFREEERPQLASECAEMRLLRMARFGRAEIREMTAFILGKDLGGNSKLVSFLEHETEGNPFFLIEAVRELSEFSGRLDSISPETLPEHVFSGGMRDYVHRRLERLPSWTQRPIQTAAIIGREIDVDVLRAAAPRTDLDALLVACGSAAILEGYGHKWRFAHEKIRTAVLSQIGDDLRREISLQVASAIEAVYDTAPEWTYSQAMLWKEAGVPDRASHYLLLTAGQILATGAPEKALRFAIDSARQLDVDLPDSHEKQSAAVASEMDEIATLLAGRVPSQIADLPQRTDEQITRIIGILLLICPCAHISRHLELFALSTLKCFKLTLEYGVGPDAPRVIAMYAVVTRELSHDSRLAYEYSTLAMSLDEKLHGYVSSSVAFVHSWFVNHWINPVRTNLSFSWEGAHIGLKDSDLLYGCFNAAAHVMYMSFGGTPLQQVVQEADRQLARISGRVRVAAFHCLLERQIAQALLGNTAHRLSLTDKDHDEERDIASICATSNYTQIAYYHLSKMRLHYFFGEYGAALRRSDQISPLLPAFQGQVGEWDFAFYRALTSAARAQELSGPEHDRLIQSVEELMNTFIGWAEVGACNFAHKRDLIHAELLWALNEWERTSDAFEMAVVSAAKSGFIHDQALAHERAALYYLSRGVFEKSARHGQTAVAHYDRWEAWAKSAGLRQELLLSRSPTIPSQLLKK